MTLWPVSVLCLLSTPLLVSCLPYGDVSSALPSSKFTPYPSFGLPSSSSLGPYGFGPASAPAYNGPFPGYNFAAGSNFGIRYGRTYPSYKTSAGFNQALSGAAYNLPRPYPGFISGGYTAYNDYNSYPGVPQPRVSESAGPVFKTVSSSSVGFAPVATEVRQQYPVSAGTSYGDFNQVGRKQFTLYGQ